MASTLHALPYDTGISLFPVLQPIRTRIFTGGYIGELTQRVTKPQVIFAWINACEVNSTKFNSG